jgi:hypothetical protein
MPKRGVDVPLDDVEFYRRLGPRERARLLAEVCRAAAALLRSRSDAERAVAYVDPLPASTTAALARLRRIARSPEAAHLSAGRGSRKSSS